MRGEWTAADGNIWQIKDHFFHGQVEIEIRRHLNSDEKPEIEGYYMKQVARLYLSRQDIEAIFPMLMNCSQPRKERFAE